jgi:hypothetical protein
MGTPSSVGHETERARVAASAPRAGAAGRDRVAPRHAHRRQRPRGHDALGREARGVAPLRWRRGHARSLSRSPHAAAPRAGGARHPHRVAHVAPIPCVRGHRDPRVDARHRRQHRRLRVRGRGAAPAAALSRPIAARRAVRKHLPRRAVPLVLSRLSRLAARDACVQRARRVRAARVPAWCAGRRIAGRWRPCQRRVPAHARSGAGARPRFSGR